MHRAVAEPVDPSACSVLRAVSCELVLRTSKVARYAIHPFYANRKLCSEFPGPFEGSQPTTLFDVHWVVKARHLATHLHVCSGSADSKTACVTITSQTMGL